MLAAPKFSHTLGWMASRMREVAVSLCSALETPPGGLCPDLGSPTQERHQSVGADPEEDHRDDPLYRNAERLGAA